MESIGVAMCFSSEIYMRAFKLSATASLLLLSLPSLVFSLLLLALFSLVLFLPIACAFVSVFLFASIFVRIPFFALVRKSLNFASVFHAPSTSPGGNGKGDLSTVENSQVCLVFDRSEVPFEEEGTTEGEEEESEGRYEEFVDTDGEEIQTERREEDKNVAEQEEWLNDIKMISHKNWGRFSSFSSSLNSHEGHGFHGILAFWRRKESEAEEAAIAR